MRSGIFLFSVLLANCPSPIRAVSVNIRNIDEQCGRIPAPETLGTSLPSLIIQRNKGAHKIPCKATLNVLTESLLKTPFKFYIKVTALNLPKTAEGECYHSVRIDGVAGAPEYGVELCGKLSDAAETEFVSVDHDIDITWDASNESDPVLQKRGLYEGSFKVVITVFTEASPVLGCPDETDPRRPEISSKYHQCTNGRCIDERLVCNRFNNCGDEEASDEQDCNFDADGGLLYIIMGIVIGGISLTITLIYFLFLVDWDGENGTDESGEMSDVDDDDEGEDAEEAEETEVYPTPVRPARVAQIEDRMDGSKTPTPRLSASLDLETIHEELQDTTE